MKRRHKHKPADLCRLRPPPPAQGFGIRVGTNSRLDHRLIFTPQEFHHKRLISGTLLLAKAGVNDGAYLSCRACSTHSNRLLQQEDLVFIRLQADGPTSSSTPTQAGPLTLCSVIAQTLNTSHLIKTVYTHHGYESQAFFKLLLV